MPPANPQGPNRLNPTAYVLRIRQNPQRGKVLGGKDKDRKPLDPPPVIQLFVRDPNDPAQNYLQSPYYWMAATLWHESEDRPSESGHHALCGSLVSSLHRLKDMDSSGQSRDGGFFVFGDITCKVEGKFRLKVVLYETLQGEVQGLAETVTNAFEVYNAKNFPGMAESTFMSRSFGDQGVRLRIRKESRQLLKRPASSYSPQPTMPQQLPTSMGTGAYAHTATAYPQYGQEMEESASKRQRSANTSPTYYDQARYATTMAQSPYANQAYAGYGAASTDPVTLAPSGMGMYSYDTTSRVMPLYNAGYTHYPTNNNPHGGGSSNR